MAQHTWSSNFGWCPAKGHRIGHQPAREAFRFTSLMYVTKMFF